jgi:hypothetical protein
VNQQHTSAATSMLATKSTYGSLSAQRLSERTVQGVFPERRVICRRILSNMQRRKLFIHKTSRERPLRNNVGLDGDTGLRQTVERSLTTSVRRMSELVLASCKWGELFKHCEFCIIYSKYYMSIELRCWILWNQKLRTKITSTGEIGFSRDQITNTRDSHIWSLVVSHAHIQHAVFQRNLLWTFNRILLESSSSGLMYLKKF